jgi:CBS domain-containing protein
MSPRAAARLEAMGFEDVYDYEHGKRDWGSAGFPREGRVAASPSVDVARGDTPTCSLTDDLGEVRERIRASGWDTCVVVSWDGIVLGRLGRRALRGTDAATVEEAMTEGPSTIRPSIGLEKLVERMRRHDLTSFVVTTSDGRLVGVVRREEAEQRLLHAGPPR